MAVIVVTKSPKMKAPKNTFIRNLAVADLLVNVLCVPFTLLSNLYPGKIHFHFHSGKLHFLFSRLINCLFITFNCKLCNFNMSLEKENVQKYAGEGYNTKIYIFGFFIFNIFLRNVNI